VGGVEEAFSYQHSAFSKKAAPPPALVSLIAES
jgi:hypothetical protein